MKTRTSQLILVTVSALAVVLLAWGPWRNSVGTGQGGATPEPIYMYVNGLPVYLSHRDAFATEVRSTSPELSAAQIDADVKDRFVEMVVWEQQAQALGVVVPQDDINAGITNVYQAATEFPEQMATDVLVRVTQQGFSSLEEYLTAGEDVFRQGYAEGYARRTLEAQAAISTPSPEEIQAAIQDASGQISLLSVEFGEEVQAEQFKQDVLAELQVPGLGVARREIEELFYRHTGTPTPDPNAIAIAIGTSYDLNGTIPQPLFVTNAVGYPVGHVGMVEDAGVYTVYLVLAKDPEPDATAIVRGLVDRRRKEFVHDMIRELIAEATVTMLP